MRPEALLVATFAAMIVVATLCLHSPLAQRGEPISLIDAFFTATSAVCVTGLTTVDKLGKARPYVFLGAFVVGMLLTPPDIISQIMLAIPVYLLYELGIIMAKLFKSRPVK